MSQSRRWRASWFATGVFGCLLVVSEAAAQPSEYSVSVRPYSAPDVALVDRHDKPVQLRAILEAEGPVMLNFIFTRCRGICPVMSTIFSNVAKELGPDAEKVRMISISIDPETDTPKQLAAYASRYGAGPRWLFLTGSAENIVAVQRAFDTWRPDKMGHAPLTLLRPSPGAPWVRIEGFASARELAQEYRKVVVR